MRYSQLCVYSNWGEEYNIHTPISIQRDGFPHILAGVIGKFHRAIQRRTWETII